MQERVLKLLQVWSDWFLFSDAYVNGLRATFLRLGNSGVIPFHSLCGDAPEIERKANSDNLGDGGKINQDAELAMGKGGAMKELMNLPFGELERRCRHNGLSLVGGREMMVARLLSLEEEEKQSGFELDEHLKYSNSHSGRYSSSSRETKVDRDRAEISGWNRFGDDDTDFQRMGSVPLAQTLSIPQPELKGFTKSGKNEPVLPISKWAREDDESDNEQKGGTRGLGLSYSSSGSENAGDGSSKADEMDITTEASVLMQPDSGLNEEQRYVVHF